MYDQCGEKVVRHSVHLVVEFLLGTIVGLLFGRGGRLDETRLKLKRSNFRKF